MVLNLFVFHHHSFDLFLFTLAFLFSVFVLPPVLCFVGLIVFGSVSLFSFTPSLQNSTVIEVFVLTGKLEECSDGLLPPLRFLCDEGQFNQTQEEDQLASSQGYCGHQIA